MAKEVWIVEVYNHKHELLKMVSYDTLNNARERAAEEREHNNMCNVYKSMLPDEYTGEHSI